MLTGWQHAYLDFREGLIEESDVQIPGLQRVYRSGRYPVLPEYWRSVRDNYRPDFAEWPEENIVDADPD